MLQLKLLHNVNLTCAVDALESRLAHMVEVEVEVHELYNQPVSLAVRRATRGVHAHAIL
jgi:hypothetical protein